MRRAALFCIVGLLTAGTAIAGTVRAEVNLSIPPLSKKPLSRAYFTYLNFLGNPANEPVRFEHLIDGTSAWGSGYVTTPHSSSIQAELAIAGTCYRAFADVWADDSSAGAGSPEVCYLPSTRPPPPTGEACTEYTLPEDCQLSPIVINLAPGAYRLSDAGDPVQFDLTADGVVETITWTERHAAMAFLALDRNGNGLIDDGSELFGNHTRKPDGTFAANGFDALSTFDDDGNALLDARDAAWRTLLLWTDANHNGRSESGESLPLAGSGITALGLSYGVTGRRDDTGNIYKYRAHLQRGQQTDTYYDIYFRRVQ
ncbi:MAG TPA: hypothetical protein VGF69_13150 [Thermoanaerobaculia bacterium]|jgi:hypothetical protein